MDARLLLLLLPSPLFLHKPSISFQRSSFLGPTLTLPIPPSKPYLLRRGGGGGIPPISAAVKRRKELPFDNVIQRDKKLKLVLKIRNILVSQPDRTMNLRDLGRFRRDLGLTRKRRFIALLRRFPAVFHIRSREMEERNLIMDRPPKFKRVKLPIGLNLSKGEMRRISVFKEIPYTSPYSDFSQLRAGSAQKEKHACAVVHEILSLTLEKRTLVDHFTHFREEFRSSQQLRGMLIRHPDMFYVSLKGDRDSVFLREAYRDSQLLEKDTLLLLKEKMRALVAVPRFSNRNAGKTDVVAEGEGASEEGDDDEEC